MSLKSSWYQKNYNIWPTFQFMPTKMKCLWTHKPINSNFKKKNKIKYQNKQSCCISLEANLFQLFYSFQKCNFPMWLKWILTNVRMTSGEVGVGGERGRSSLFYSRSIHLPSPLRYIKLVYYLFTRYIWTPSVTSEGVVGNSEVWCQMKHTHHVVYPQYHQLLFKFTSRNNMFFWREWHPNTLTRSSAQLTSTWHLMPLKLGTITG